MRDVLVIGAGMAGVTAAREMAGAGMSVTVVEASSHVGGRIESIRDFGGQPVEAGAEFIHGTGAETWRDVRAAGLDVRPCPLTRHTMFNVGGRTRWLPWILLHPGTWRAFTIIRSLSRLGPPDMSAREFIQARGYRGRARVLAEMVLTAHLPGDLDQVGMLGLVDDGVLKLENGRNHRVVDGYDRLPHFIARTLDIDFGFTVESVRWDAGCVTVCSTDGRETSARTAVCTLPVGVIKAGRVRFVPELPPSKRSALEGLVMGPVVKLLLLFEEPFWPGWLANLGCGTGPVTLYWPPFYGAREKPPVLTAYSTGPRAAHLSKVSEEEAADIALADLSRHFPKADPRRRVIQWRRVDWAQNPLTCGGYTLVRPGSTGARAALAAADTGALFWAGSATVTSPIAASVEAAYLSGLRAAAQVRRFLETLSA